MKELRRHGLRKINFLGLSLESWGFLGAGAGECEQLVSLKRVGVNLVVCLGPTMN